MVRPEKGLPVQPVKVADAALAAVGKPIRGVAGVQISQSDNRPIETAFLRLTGSFDAVGNSRGHFELFDGPKSIPKRT